MITAFHLIATFLLAVMAATWSSTGWPNIFIKLIFVAATVIGTIVSAKDLIAAGWL